MIREKWLPPSTPCGDLPTIKHLCAGQYCPLKKISLKREKKIQQQQKRRREKKRGGKGGKSGGCCLHWRINTAAEIKEKRSARKKNAATTTNKKKNGVDERRRGKEQLKNAGQQKKEEKKKEALVWSRWPSTTLGFRPVWRSFSLSLSLFFGPYSFSLSVVFFFSSSPIGCRAGRTIPFCCCCCSFWLADYSMIGFPIGWCL